MDYFSRYVEVALLQSSQTSREVIRALKSIFARHGIPEMVRSDNGPQYDSAEFIKFAKDWSFHHVTSSPRFPQSNGAVERAIQTAGYTESTDTSILYRGTGTGTIRRNRRDLVPLSPTAAQASPKTWITEPLGKSTRPDISAPDTARKAVLTPTQTRSGRVVVPPVRLDL